jgi:hypothetical protein
LYGKYIDYRSQHWAGGVGSLLCGEQAFGLEKGHLLPSPGGMPRGKPKTQWGEQKQPGKQ